MTGKEYVRPMPALWWLRNRHLTFFMIREVSSLFVAGYSIFLLVMLYRFGQGEAPFHAFFQALSSPLSIIIQLVAFAMVIVHTVTSINAAPVLMVLWRGDEKVDPSRIVAANYAAWFIASMIILTVAGI
jgi:fumarate reductase subunit C